MPAGRPRGRANLAADLAAHLQAQITERHPVDDGTNWPSVKYQTNPVGFASEVLGIELWSKQVEIVEAIRDNLRVAVSSGNKVGKTTLVAVCALWFFCSYPEARVWITASSAKQVTQAVWREIRRLVRKARERGYEIGDPRQHAGSGLTRASDDSQIMGFSAANKENAQGISGKLMFIIDEASGLDDDIYDAIQGNRAGGGVRLIAIGNPTKNEGFFYRAFKDAKTAKLWVPYTISGEETPNASGTGWIEGLQSREWIDEIIAEHGRDSVIFKVRVEGKFVEGEEGRLNPLHNIIMAQQNWAEASEHGPLVIGLDPAGIGENGDETVFAPLREFKCYAMHPHRALSATEILRHLQGYIKQYAPSLHEIVIVAVDREGAIGNEVYGVLRAAMQVPGARFRVIGVKSSDKAKRLPNVYHLVRDELWACSAQWLKDGGGIPPHHKLEADLHAPSWAGRTVHGLEKVTHKDDMKKILGRSPDYADALNLAIWCRLADAAGEDPGVRRLKLTDARHEGTWDDPHGKEIDPYG